VNEEIDFKIKYQGDAGPTTAALVPRRATDVEPLQTLQIYFASLRFLHLCIHLIMLPREPVQRNLAGNSVGG
jgi:hypothetical protein